MGGCITSFVLGAKLGQSVRNGEKIELPKLEPLKAIREHEERKEAERESKRLEAILRNIEAYDGTSRNQEDIPR